MLRNASCPSSESATRLLKDVGIEIVDISDYTDATENPNDGYSSTDKGSATDSGSSSDCSSSTNDHISTAGRSPSSGYSSIEGSELSPASRQDGEESDVAEISTHRQVGDRTYLAVHPSHLRSPGLERMLCRGEVAALYFPNSNPSADSTMRALLQTGWSSTNSPALLRAMDAFCLSKLGLATQNQSCYRQGARYYESAVGMLRQGVQRAVEEQYVHSDYIATCYALMSYQCFDTLGHGEASIQMHLKGLADMFVARGPDSLSEYDQILLHDYLSYAFRFGTTFRKPVHDDIANWWLKNKADVDYSCFYRHLSNLTAHLPVLLQESDRLCAEADTRAEDASGVQVRAKHLLKDLTGLDAALLAWLQAWHFSFQDLPYWPVPARSYRQLTTFMSEVLLDVFPTVLMFPSWTIAVEYSRLWASLLLVRSTAAELCSSVPSLEKPGQIIPENITECADNLCACFAYFCDRKLHGLTGPIFIAAGGRLHVASQYYEKTQDLPKLSWCNSFSDLIRSQGVLNTG